MVLGDGDDVHVPCEDKDEGDEDTDEDMNDGIHHGGGEIWQASSLTYKVHMLQGADTEQGGYGGEEDQDPGHQEEQTNAATSEDCGIPAIIDKTVSSSNSASYSQFYLYI